MEILIPVLLAIGLTFVGWQSYREQQVRVHLPTVELSQVDGYRPNVWMGEDCDLHVKDFTRIGVNAPSPLIQSDANTTANLLYVQTSAQKKNDARKEQTKPRSMFVQEPRVPRIRERTRVWVSPTAYWDLKNEVAPHEHSVINGSEQIQVMAYNLDLTHITPLSVKPKKARSKTV